MSMQNCELSMNVDFTYILGTFLEIEGRELSKRLSLNFPFFPILQKQSSGHVQIGQDFENSNIAQNHTLTISKCERFRR